MKLCIRLHQAEFTFLLIWYCSVLLLLSEAIGVLIGDKTTKTVNMPESKAQEWEAYVEYNAEVDSISYLVRLSVQKKISGAYDVDTRRSDDDSAAANGEEFSPTFGRLRRP
jgi:hypothetical protein